MAKPLIFILFLLEIASAMSKAPMLYLADSTLGDYESRFGKDSVFVFEKTRERIGRPITIDSLISGVREKDFSESKILLTNGQWKNSQRIEAFKGFLISDGDTLKYDRISALYLKGPFRLKYWSHMVLGMGVVFGAAGLVYDGVEYIESKDKYPGATAGFSSLGFLFGAVLGYFARDRLYVLIQHVDGFRHY